MKVKAKCRILERQLKLRETLRKALEFANRDGDSILALDLGPMTERQWRKLASTMEDATEAALEIANAIDAARINSKRLVRK